MTVNTIIAHVMQSGSAKFGWIHQSIPHCSHDLRHGLTTRNHGDLVDGIMVREQGANDGMARFMVGNEFLRGIVLVIKKKERGYDRLNIFGNSFKIDFRIGILVRV